MKKNLYKFYCILTILFGLFSNAQNVKIVDTSNNPLTNVLVFDKEANLLTRSDVEGNFDKKDIEPLQDFYILKQANALEDTIFSKEFLSNIIILNNRTVQIPELIISAVSNPNYIVVRGYFNNYITLNKKLNCYVDGIVEYTFDYKTKKHINSNLIQYRTFIRKEKSENRKEISSLAFESMIRIPELDKLTDPEEIKNDTKLVWKKNIDDKNNTANFEYTKEKFQNKVLNLFGYQFTEGSFSVMFSLSKSKKYHLIKDLTYFNRFYQLNMKHKTEENFTLFQGYSNFYPEKVFYLKDKKSYAKLKLNKNKSHYSDAYWKNTVLESTYNTFSNFFKTDLEEQPNKWNNK